ncbi:NAD-dependent epimerase/dehydratase family protein [candidate division KSB1 bacterium]|nr:NAD-dependent epimerase/dehydratase family protein [bacterium]NUM68293.1 NAD-dependent epimerase/dehydratase family protein [candidate division KSB1 bacterium]
MNILITGGTGFISTRLTQQLLDAGHHVTVFTRGISTSLLTRTAQLQHIRGDRRNEADLAALPCRTWDVVYDMVAYEPEESQLAVKVFRGKVGRFIHCSTISVYMVSNELQCPITEDQDQAPVMEFWPRNPFGMDYGIKKRQCEEILWKAHDEKRFPVTVLRPTFVSGPNDPAKRDFFWIERILDGKPLLIPGSGDFAFQQVYVEDVARAFANLLDFPQSRGRAFNVAAEEVFSLNEYLHALGRLLACKPELVHVDQNVFDRHSLSRHPAGDVFPFNTRRTAIFSVERIRAETNYRTTPFKEWMPVTISWFTKNFRGHSIGYERREEEVAAAQCGGLGETSLSRAGRAA